jgi:hypothetical protein
VAGVWQFSEYRESTDSLSAAASSALTEKGFDELFFLPGRKGKIVNLLLTAVNVSADDKSVPRHPFPLARLPP